MKTLITAQDQFSSILRSLAKENGGIATGIKTITLATALKETTDPEEILLFTLKKELSRKKDSFPIYRDMFAYPSFLQEILSFVQKCIFYDIDADSLPDTNNNEKELKEIVRTALSLPYAWKTSRNNVHSSLEKLKHRDDIIIYPQFIKDPYHYRILSELKQSLPVYQQKENHPEISLRYSFSSRQEIEAVAQDICTREKTCNVILTNPKLQYPLLKMTFERYGIPFRAAGMPSVLHIPLIFSSLLRYSVHEEVSLLEDACTLNSFGTEIDDPVRHYLFAHFDSLNQGITISTDLAEDPLFSDRSEMYRILEQKSLDYLSSIKEKLDLIHSSTSVKEKVIHCYTILSQHPLLKSANELKAAVSVRNTVQNVLPYIENDSDIQFLADYMESSSATEDIEVTDFCTVTDLSHPVQPAEVTYVISADGSSYPGVPSESGLFDEKYVSSISAFPTQVERNDIYTSQLSWIENSAEEMLIYSWHTNDYQGREVQLALEIEQKYSERKEQWPLAVTRPEVIYPHRLSSETAHSLFQKDNVITGSISTIERFFHCPYSYFIQSGLKVRKPDYGELNAAGVGTIQHFIFESAVSQHHSTYAEISEEEVRSYIENPFLSMMKMHPSEKEQILLTKERMVHGIMLVLKFLSSFEKGTSFEPAETELRFCEEIIEGVKLRGIIDRVDFYGNEMFRIIDYKSSVHSLSETKIKAGIQLQLLSYALIAEKLTGKIPAGAYYCSLKQETVDVIAKKKSRKEIIETEFDEEADETRMMDSRQLIGWTFTDRTTELDESGKNIATLNKRRDFEMIRYCMNEIYTLFKTRLLSGDISLSPDEEACKFCDYRSVCRYHGEYRKIKPLVCEDDSLTVGKES